MAIDWSLHAVASIATLATTCLCTLPLLYQQLGIFTHRHSYEPIGFLYQDEDGNATKESQQRYSVRIQKHLILFGSSAGTALAVTNAVQIIVGNLLADCTSITGVIYPCLDALTWVCSRATTSSWKHKMLTRSLDTVDNPRHLYISWAKMYLRIRISHSAGTTSVSDGNIY